MKPDFDVVQRIGVTPLTPPKFSYGVSVAFNVKLTRCGGGGFG
jgi:hypothetical protein